MLEYLKDIYLKLGFFNQLSSTGNPPNSIFQQVQFSDPEGKHKCNIGRKKCWKFPFSRANITERKIMHKKAHVEAIIGQTISE